MGGLIVIEWKRCKSTIHDHDHSLWVTMMRQVDVQDKDWDDLRIQHPINITRDTI